MINRKRPTILIVTALLTLCCGTAAAEIVLRWAPADTLIEIGQGGRLSLVIDDTTHVRTIDVRVSYDPAIVASLGGGKGVLFNGLNTFPHFIEEAPGVWYGFTVVLGSELYAQGPGELYYWNFEGVDNGMSWIETVDIALAEDVGDETIWRDVSLDRTSIRVGDQSGAEAPDMPEYGLELAPNPFNPRTVITLPPDPAGGRQASLTVLDQRGRMVKKLWEGEIPSTRTDLLWYGEDAYGHSQASGVYLFLFQREDGFSSVIRGTLIR